MQETQENTQHSKNLIFALVVEQNIKNPISGHFWSVIEYKTHLCHINPSIKTRGETSYSSAHSSHRAEPSWPAQLGSARQIQNLKKLGSAQLAILTNQSSSAQLSSPISTGQLSSF